MAWRPHGRARVNARQPQAFAICDRCGMLYNLVDLKWQYDWRGDTLTNLKIRVCTKTCYDKPYEGRRPLKLPADPVPVIDPRPTRYALDEQNVPNEPFWDEAGLLFDDGQTEFEP